MEDIVMEMMTEEELQERMETQELQEKIPSEELPGETEKISEVTEKKNYTRPNFWKDNRGVGVIEIVLILVILIGLVLVFKEEITAIVNDAFAAISGDAGKIIN